MNRHLKRLIQIVPPPEDPLECGDAVAFLEAEEKLSLKLPDDYKELISTYGSGKWQDFWWHFNPFANSPYSNLFDQSLPADDTSGGNALSAERAAREDQNRSHAMGIGIKYPHAIYPEPGGILPWARTENGGRFFWLTKGKTGNWSTIYYAGRSPRYEEFKVTCTELVFGAVTGELPIFNGIFEEDFEYGQQDAFIPIKRKRKRKKS